MVGLQTQRDNDLSFLLVRMPKPHPERCTAKPDRMAAAIYAGKTPAELGGEIARHGPEISKNYAAGMDTLDHLDFVPHTDQACDPMSAPPASLIPLCYNIAIFKLMQFELAFP